MLVSFLLALSLITLSARLCAKLCGYLGQPPVMGEVLAGIALGPSLLGWLAPAAEAYLFPAQIAPVLTLFAQIGVILYMFLVGLEFDASLISRRRRVTIAVSVASILAPFALGLGLGEFLWPRFGGGEHLAFLLFVSVAVSVTAFPVLARILGDRGATQTPIGQLALACAASNDIVAWCLLSLVAGIAQHTSGNAVRTVAWSVAFGLAMILVVRPLMRRLSKRTESDSVFSVVLAMLLGAALASEFIGVHALFGAFLFGAIIDHQSPLAQALDARLRTLVSLLLLPVFFASTGLRTELALICSGGALLAIIAVASVGKIGGTFVAARWSGESSRSATALGVLMNTRGLMELIVLTTGLQLGILSPTLFAMFVVMALVTTFATTPLFTWLTRARA